VLVSGQLITVLFVAGTRNACKTYACRTQGSTTAVRAKVGQVQCRVQIARSTSVPWNCNDGSVTGSASHYCGYTLNATSVMSWKPSESVGFWYLEENPLKAKPGRTVRFSGFICRKPFSFTCFLLIFYNCPCMTCC
jgi:hypothetical protein